MAFFGGETESFVGLYTQRIEHPENKTIKHFESEAGPGVLQTGV